MQMAGSMVSMACDVEELLGIEVAELVAQPEAAAGNGADAAPLAVVDFEDSCDEILGGAIAAAVEDAGVLIFDFGAAGLQLLDGHEHAFENIERLKACDHDGHMEARGEGFVFACSRRRRRRGRGREIPGRDFAAS